MRPPNEDRRLLLERFADGELSDAEHATVAAMLDEDADAREYVAALAELRELVALPLDAAAETVDFSGLFDRVEARLDAPERSRALDEKVVAFADGQLADADKTRVSAYIDAHPGARAGFDAIRDLGEIVRAPIDAASATVDFAALARRIDAAIDRELASVAPARREVAAQPSLWHRLLDAIGGPRAILASAVTAAAAFVILRPGTQPDPATPVEIHNHYYEMPAAETVGYDFDSIQKGFQGTFQPEDKVADMAPVIWITAEAPTDAPDGSSPAANAFQKDPSTDPDAGSQADVAL